MTDYTSHPPEVYALLHDLIVDKAFHAITRPEDEDRVTMWMDYAAKEGMVAWERDRDVAGAYVLMATPRGRLCLEMWNRAAARPPKRRTGRPKASEKGAAEKVVAALSKWHRYQEDGSVTNYTPARNRDLVEMTKEGKGRPLVLNSLSRFLEDKFGKHAHRKYAKLCSARTIATQLKLWRGEVPLPYAELRDSDARPTD